MFSEGSWRTSSPGFDEQGAFGARAREDAGRGRILQRTWYQIVRIQLPLPDIRLIELLSVISLSKKHKDQPWGIDVHGQRYEVNYWPGDSMSGMFGGNSNWRGPICR